MDWLTKVAAVLLRYSEPILPAQHRANGVDGCIQALRNLAIGGFQAARAGDGIIELVRQPRTIGVQRMNLVRQTRLLIRAIEPPLERSFQRLQG